MKQFKLLLPIFIALSLINCTGADEKEKLELNDYQKCLDNFFENIPLGSCASFASDNSEKRIIQLEKKEKELTVKIQIPECLSQLELYHSWVAAELQSECLNNSATRFEFNDGGATTYFSFKSKSLPTFFTQENRVLIIDKKVNADAIDQIKKALFDPKLPSERTYYVSQTDNGEIQINHVVHIKAGNEEQHDDAHQQLTKLSAHFATIQLDHRVTFHTVEKYGRQVFSL